jgi:selenocysteine lyase/cysteine desulfurase
MKTTDISQSDFPAAQSMTYLNAASTALMYKPAATSIIDWQSDLAEFGTLNFDEVAEVKIYDDLREAAAKLFNAKPIDIAVGSNATELLCSLAWATLPQKGEVVVGTEASFPSVVYPWQRISRQVGCKIRLAKVNQYGLIDENELLDLIDEKTAIVTISHVEYKSGQTYDLETISQKAHDNGALLIVDATQSAGQIPIDVQKIKADAIVASGYKWLCGPFGSAFMYLAPHHQKSLDPGIVGWRSHKDIWDMGVTRLEFPSSAKRFEASTLGYGLIIGLAKAINFLTDIGIENIYSHNLALVDILIKELQARGANILLSAIESQRSSILSVEFPNMKSKHVVKCLDEEKIIVSLRENIRISPHLYNDEKDILQLLEVIDSILQK